METYSGFLYNRGERFSDVEMMLIRGRNLISTSIWHRILMEKCQKINCGDHDYTGHQSTYLKLMSILWIMRWMLTSYFLILWEIFAPEMRVWFGFSIEWITNKFHKKIIQIHSLFITFHFIWSFQYIILYINQSHILLLHLNNQLCSTLFSCIIYNYDIWSNFCAD